MKVATITGNCKHCNGAELGCKECQHGRTVSVSFNESTNAKTVLSLLNLLSQKAVRPFDMNVSEV